VAQEAAKGGAASAGFGLGKKVMTIEEARQILGLDASASLEAGPQQRTWHPSLSSTRAAVTAAGAGPGCLWLYPRNPRNHSSYEAGPPKHK